VLHERWRLRNKLCTLAVAFHKGHGGFADKSRPVKLLHQLTACFLSRDRCIVREGLYFATLRMEYRTKTCIPTFKVLARRSERRSPVTLRSSCIKVQVHFSVLGWRIPVARCGECFWKRAGSEHEAIL
jgi:hypothetical protein